MTDLFGQEIIRGERFRFGQNWRRYLATIDDERIAAAEKSLKEMIGVEDLRGKSFLDIGSGSGLFSLAARRLSASVRSFDYDPESVACGRELKEKHFPDDLNWILEFGSVLDTDYLQSLPKFDIVYSWGVLHHTGAMWEALGNAAIPVATGGKLFIAIYNDQNGKSKAWRRVKRLYCSGAVGRFCVLSVFVPCFVIGGLLADIFKGNNPIKRYIYYKKARGMTRIYDWCDWLGGYPFEVAKPEDIFGFYRARGFVLERLVTCGGGLGNNQFVFTKQ